MQTPASQTQTHTVYLGMGTNVGDRQANLMAAIAALPPEVEMTRRSAIFQTPPWGYTDQPDFLNLVVEAATRLSPLELLAHLKQIEGQIGRTETFHWGPREIDIDILFYDDLLFEDSGLTIPHPRLHERAFVLLPLSALAPDLRHPKLGQSVRAMLAEVDTSGLALFEGPVTTQNKD